VATAAAGPALFTIIVKVRFWPGVNEDGLTDFTTDRSAVPGAGVDVGVGVAGSGVAVGVFVNVAPDVCVGVIVDVGVGVAVKV